MDENKTYSAEELISYAHGQMPMAERHALEKAALEDPFLAGALDGYVEKVIGPTVYKPVDEAPKNLPSQLKELRKIIAGKAADQKEKRPVSIISIFRNKRLQTAVAAILIFGVAWWLYAISNRPKEETLANNKQIAQAWQQVPTVPITADTALKRNQELKPAVIDTRAKQAQIDISADKKIQEHKTVSPPAGNDEAAKVYSEKAASANAPVVMADTIAKQSKDRAMNDATVSNPNAYKKDNLSKTTAVGYGMQQKAEERIKNVAVAMKPSFVFQGRILDANHNPLPFSNIMVPGKNFGTYSDGEGYFNFVYTDSILPVRAKSLGFETQNFNMHANEKENQIVLNEDKNLHKSITFLRSEKQKNRAGFKPTFTKVDTISSSIEPFVGWHNYGIYLANNNRISNAQFYSSRSVLLSFEISQDGGIKNITVEKSQGKYLDTEAIRLLKEGPKWKQKKDGKKGEMEVKF